MAAYRNKTVASLFTLGLLALIAVLALVWFGGGDVGAQEEPPSSANVPITIPTREPETPAQLCANDTTVPGHAENPGLVADCVALMAARDALQGTKTLDWSYDSYIGNWKGITVGNVDGSDRVTKLKLHGSTFDGTIPPELGGLSALQTLDLRDSPELTGPIPAELGELSSLQHLILVNHGAFSSGIPKELGKLSSLQTLIMFQIGLNGGIPSELGDLSALKTLQLSSNQLTGTIPATLVYLDNLEKLSLSGNQLTGCIPAALSAVKVNDLSTLGLSPCTTEQLCADDITVPGHTDNAGLVDDCAALMDSRDALQGTADLAWKYGLPIHQWEGVRVRPAIQRVVKLELKNRSLTGSIPPELGGLPNLTHLHLSLNQLTGEIPAALGNLTSLAELRLANNQLSGPIPAELGGLSSLTELVLQNNQLSGGIPTELGNLSSLDNLNLSNNQLTREIPAELGSASSLTKLALADNQLSGSVPASLADLDGLTRLWLSGNQLSGCLPRQLLSVSSNDLYATGLDPCPRTAEEVCQSDEVVPDRASNPGLLADCMALFSLQRHWNAQSTLGWRPEKGDIASWRGVGVGGTPRRVNSLTLARQGLSGTIPPEIGGLTALRRLDLSGNGLWWEVPAEINSLTELRILNLSGNALTGDLCATLRDLSHLHTLDLGGNSGRCNPQGWASTGLRYLDLSELQVNNLPSRFYTVHDELRYLDLSNTEWGSIPGELGSLTSLEYLDFSDNRLRGEEALNPIPRELGNLSQLRHLDLSVSLSIPSDAEYSGALPAELGNLANLEYLNLANRSLTGTLPVSLTRLAKLEFLDISHNLFSGQIPREIGDMTNLQVLRIGENRFSGILPKDLADLSNLVHFMIKKYAHDDGSLDLCREIGLDLDELTGIEGLNYEIPECGPGPVTNVRVTEGSGQLSVSWSPPEYDHGRAIEQYGVDYNGSDGKFGTTTVSDLTTLAVTLTGLTPNTEYNIGIKAFDGVKWGGRVTVRATPTN